MSIPIDWADWAVSGLSRKIFVSSDMPSLALSFRLVLPFANIELGVCKVGGTKQH